MGILDLHPNFAAIELERIAVFARLNLAMADITGRRGRYAQLLASPAQALDGTSRAAFTTRQVTDEAEPWPNLSAETASGVRGQYFVHRHDHPDGSHEYTLGCRIVWNGVEYLYLARGGAGGQWVEVEED